MNNDLKLSILESLERAFRHAERCGILTLGVEQEFFLYSGGRVVSHRESQEFLNSLSTVIESRAIWKHDEGVGHHLANVRMSIDGRDVDVKYDHHPHLLEIAFPPIRSLVELEKIINSVLIAIDTTCCRVGLRVEYSPFLREGQSPDLLQSCHSLCVALRDYRRRVSPMENSLEILNFSAYIAATQFHIGGCPWSKVANIINNLYLSEARLGQVAWSYIDSALRLPSKRFSGYFKSLPNYPLVGYPRMEQWSWDAWLECLFRMPIAQTVDNKSATHVDWTDPEAILGAKRDLTIIKPRLFGTIEFRGDPCLPSADSILAVAAARLGYVQYCLQVVDNGCSLIDSSKAWYAMLQEPGKIGIDMQIIAQSRIGLLSRGLGEEKYLPMAETKNEA